MPDEAATLAVAGLNLERGSPLVLFGPNAAGKTTLLRRLAGVSGPAPLGLSVAYLPQRPYLFRGPVRRTVLAGLDEASRRRVNELADRLGVADLLERRSRGVSGGERQRLLLARALGMAADIVALDEPLAAVDARDRAHVARVIAAAAADRMLVVVSHDLDTIPLLGDRVAIVADGAVVQTGPVGEVFATPTSARVAEIIGIRNVIEGAVADTDEALVFVDAGGFRVAAVGEVDRGDPATVWFGAEAVTVHVGETHHGGSARNRWEGTVRQIRPMGRLVEVLVDVEGHDVVALITPGSRDGLGLAEGSAVVLSLKAAAARAVPRVP